MKYKPSEVEWMAYLYGEMEDAERERMERHLAENPEARAALESFKALQLMLNTVKDKEVIAPPIVMSDDKKHRFFNFPYAKTVISIAASLLLLMVVGRITNTSVASGDGELHISFGNKPNQMATQKPVLTEEEIQQMINNRIAENNKQWETGLAENGKKQNEALHKTLARYVQASPSMDELVKQVASASKEQVQSYVAGLQTENLKMMKDYLQLTSSEQKNYMENLLVDFSKYLQQQRNDDLRLLQTKIIDVEQNNNIFKAETEQILTSLINTPGYQKTGTRN
jgi:hypothetical protein